MELTAQETEILELLDTVIKKIDALPPLGDLHSRALDNLYNTIFAISSRPYQRKLIANARMRANVAVLINTAVGYTWDMEDQ